MRHRCHISDKEGEHKGVRCYGHRSGQCICPIYSGYLPVLRTCSDHSNEVIPISATVALCATPGQSTLTAEQTVSRDCLARCDSCLDTNLCAHSCVHPGPACQACANPAYFRCAGSCLHPGLVCDGHVQCNHGEDEAWERCQTTYRARGIDWRRYIWNIINSQYVWSRNGTLLQ